MATPDIPGITDQESYIVDTNVYSKSSLFRACYKFTDRAYIFLACSNDYPHSIVVSIKPKKSSNDPNLLIQELCNELIDQGVRETLEEELGPIRNLIVAQAFSEGNLLAEAWVSLVEDDEHYKID